MELKYWTPKLQFRWDTFRLYRRLVEIKRRIWSIVHVEIELLYDSSFLHKLLKFIRQERHIWFFHLIFAIEGELLMNIYLSFQLSNAVLGLDLSIDTVFLKKLFRHLVLHNFRLLWIGLPQWVHIHILSVHSFSSLIELQWNNFIFLQDIYVKKGQPIKLSRKWTVFAPDTFGSLELGSCCELLVSWSWGRILIGSSLERIGDDSSVLQ